MGALSQRHLMQTRFAIKQQTNINVMFRHYCNKEGTQTKGLHHDEILFEKIIEPERKNPNDGNITIKEIKHASAADQYNTEKLVGGDDKYAPKIASDSTPLESTTNEPMSKPEPSYREESEDKKETTTKISTSV